MLGERSRLPDHNYIILTKFTGSNYGKSDQCKRDNNGESEQAKFKLHKVPDNFMSSNMSSQAVAEIIASIERSRESQEQCTIIYGNFFDTILDEMNNTVPKVRSSEILEKA